jgi:multicomponent Na+:H+ antiporter subunit E
VHFVHVALAAPSLRRGGFLLHCAVNAGTINPGGGRVSAEGSVRHVSLAIALAAFWVLLSGYFTPFLLSLGAASVAAVVWFTDRRMKVLDTEGHPIHLGPRALTYWPWLAWEIAKSGWDVTKRILHPGLPISPRLVRVSADQASDVGRVIYANSITLTPGTISLELGEGEILVHALSRESAEGLLAGEMNRRAAAFEAAS